MQGNLQDMNVADLIQHNCQEPKTVRLTIQHEGQSAVLFFKDGNVVHATANGQQGEEAIYPILSWAEGTFISDPGIEPPAVTITRPWAGLLLEGARRLDEATLHSEIGFEEAKHMAQKLDDILKEMSTEVNGFIASLVVGMDGIHIACFSRSKMDADLISAQMTLLIKLVETSVTRMNAGALDENLVTTENAYLMVKELPHHPYYLALVADRKNANIGNLRLMARMFIDKIEKSIVRA